MGGNAVSNLKGPTADTDAANKHYVDDSIRTKTEPKKLSFANVSVAASAFTANTTYEDYPYRSAIALKDVTADGFIPEVIFHLQDAASGNFAPVANTYGGGVYIYAESVPENDIIIPTIICWREE